MDIFMVLFQEWRWLRMYKGGIYLSLGDSTTWSLPNEAQTGDVYPYLLAKWIKQNHGQIKWISKGIGGATSAHLTQDIQWNSLLVPDLVTIGIGMNDCLSSNNITTTQYQSNVSNVIDELRLRNPNVHIILCTPNTTTDTNRTGTVQSYRDALTSTASTKNVDICHFDSAWASAQQSTYSMDGIHPNSSGHPLLFNLLQPLIQNDTWLSRLG